MQERPETGSPMVLRYGTPLRGRAEITDLLRRRLVRKMLARRQRRLGGGLSFMRKFT